MANENIIQSLRSLSNPFEPVQVDNLPDREFVGREDFLEMFHNALNEFNDSQVISNILFIGPKSIGKSLLSKKLEFMASNNMATFPIELSEVEPIDTFQFILRLFDHIIEQFSDTNNFLDQDQITNWLSYRYKNEPTLTYVQSDLRIPYLDTSDSSLINEEIVSKDLSFLVNALVNSEADVKGIQIFIDEFQQFIENERLLEILTRVTSNINNVSIVGTGRTVIYSHLDIFNRFIRTSKKYDVKPLTEMNGEIRNAATRPLSQKLNCSDFEAQELFESGVLPTLERKTGGNPLHIRLLCSAMFENFKKDNKATNLILNRDVLEIAMNKYEAMSPMSHKIKLSLESCSDDQLEVFSQLYFFESMDLRSVIEYKMAFDNINDQTKRDILNNIKRQIIELKDNELFNVTDLEGKKLSISKIRGLPLAKSSSIKFEFIGDEIDRLYASYYYESIKKAELEFRLHDDLGSLLALKLGQELGVKLITTEIKGFDPDLFLGFSSTSDDDWSEFQNDISTIESESKSDNYKFDKIKNFNDKYTLALPSLFSRRFDLEGYFVVIIDVIVKGKHKTISVFYPITNSEQIELYKQKTIKKEKYLLASLHEYSIEIKDIKLSFLPKTVNVMIITVMSHDLYSIVISNVMKKDFSAAADKAKSVMEMNTVTDFQKQRNFLLTSDINNYAFCLINLNKVSSAKDEFKKIDKATYPLTSINLAFLDYYNGKTINARNNYKKLFSKYINSTQEAGALHLTIFGKDNYEPADQLVVQVKMRNVCAWNLCLIAAQLKERDSVKAFKKHPKCSTENEINVHNRVMFWVDHYMGDTDKARTKATKLLKNLTKDDFMYDQILHDIEVLSQ